ncbi:MAG: hypothetical protein JXA00_02425 [Candidatus Thermoplasmatota archaeon]|nr:hypothetical protein [Candidatus Thermoplasmatota archaeon]
MGSKEFLDAKERALKSLQKALTEDKVDAGVRSLLKILNDMDGVYSTSSCAGRIVLLQIPQLGEKRTATFLGIWHHQITVGDLEAAASSATTGMLWLLAQAPILHVGVQTLERADHLVKTAVSCGFKNSSVKSLGKKITIEICSTERLDAPIGVDGRVFCNKDHLSLLVEIANEVIRRSQRKLLGLERKLRIYIIYQKN